MTASAPSRGSRVRRAVLGDAHVDRAVAGTTEFTAPFQDFITRYAWGEVWSRPGLTRAERSIVTLTVLAALQHEDELAMHVRAALANGPPRRRSRRCCSRSACTPGSRCANRAPSPSPTGPWTLSGGNSKRRARRGVRSPTRRVYIVTVSDGSLGNI